MFDLKQRLYNKLSLIFNKKSVNTVLRIFILTTVSSIREYMYNTYGTLQTDTRMSIIE